MKICLGKKYRTKIFLTETTIKTLESKNEEIQLLYSLLSINKTSSRFDGQIKPWMCCICVQFAHAWSTAYIWFLGWSKSGRRNWAATKKQTLSRNYLISEEKLFPSLHVHDGWGSIEGKQIKQVVEIQVKIQLLLFPSHVSMLGTRSDRVPGVFIDQFWQLELLHRLRSLQPPSRE